MKSVLLALCLMVSSHCSASSDALKTALTWLQTWAPKSAEFKMVKSTIKFSGCKQQEYLAFLTQPLADDLFLEIGLGYDKGAYSWGGFDQKISVKEFFFVPRYQVSQSVSIGFGIVKQSQTEFKTNQGFEFNLPKNTEWLVNIRTAGFANSHYLEWTVSSQKWSASNDLGGIFEYAETNNKVGLSYNGYF